MTMADIHPRTALRMLQSRYDDGKMPQAYFDVVKKLQREIAWGEFNRRAEHGRPIQRRDR